MRFPDGNIAFKVTWVYGHRGSFSSPCTPQGRDINIRVEKKVWCSQRECGCNVLFRQGNGEEYWNQYDEWPCYDSAIFEKWMFSPGVYHYGSRAGQFIPIKHFKKGKLAFFTTKRYDEPENARRIIGCFRITDYREDRDFEGWVLVAGHEKIKVTNLDNAPLYWDFHKQNGPPRWGTGLFRYITDAEASRMYEALKNVESS